MHPKLQIFTTDRFVKRKYSILGNRKAVTEKKGSTIW